FAFYLNVPAIAVRFYGVPPIVAAGSGLILALPFIYYVVVRRERLVASATTAFVVAYFGALLVSALLSNDVAETVTPISTFLTEGLLLFLLVSNVIRTPQAVRNAMWAIALSAALMGGISVVQEVTHTYRNDYGGFAQLNLVGFNVAGQADVKIIRPRLAGPIGEQNRYAQILLVALPFAAFRVWGERRRALRILAAGAVVLILAGIFLSFSRGAAVALGALLVVLAIIGQIRVRQLAGLAALMVATMLLFAPDYLIRLDSLQGVVALFNEGDSGGADGAIVGRATSNLAALSVFVENPIIGVGPGQYFREFSQAAGNELDMRHFLNQRRAHNLYLEILADLGILGFAAFMGAVLSVLWPLWRLRAAFAVTRPDLSNLATAMVLSVLAYLFTGVFLHLSYERYFWVMLAVGVATVWVLREELIKSTILSETVDRSAASGMRSVTDPRSYGDAGAIASPAVGPPPR
ncbi:MAG: O-antigen ligase family protein, partial [Chloroflexi bacterium]|nr:O-antigen ligase family protein [Chloroflexota bacterium]